MKTNKEKLLENAKKLFQTKGYEKTTMREIAKKSNIALGSAYYYYKTKSDLVIEFYLQSQYLVEKRCSIILEEENDFFISLVNIYKVQFEYLKKDRKFLGAILSSIGDSNNLLSPFSPNTKRIRDINLAIFENLSKKFAKKIPKSIYKNLPFLLWSIQMLLLLFWMLDKSKNQANSYKLLDMLIAFLKPLFKIAKLPFANNVFSNLNNLLDYIQNSFLNITK